MPTTVSDAAQHGSRTRLAGITHRDALLDRVAADRSPRLRRRAASDPDTPAETLRRLATDSSNRVRVAALANPACPADVLIAASRWLLARRARCAAASNPRCPPEAFERLLAAGRALTQVRVAAARNPACPPRMLDRLSYDQSQAVRCAVACNPNCQPEALECLARDDYNILRGNTAANPATPAETIAALCGDPDRGVRSDAADNPSCPPGALAWVAADERSPWQQRSSVAWNSACPPQVREKLANDRNESVRSAAAASRACAPELLTRADHRPPGTGPGRRGLQPVLPARSARRCLRGGQHQHPPLGCAAATRRRRQPEHDAADTETARS